jgi:pimeloyl-ACP methyl ester carboxylesterase
MIAKISTVPETRYLTAEGGRIAYDDTGGTGPVVLALPGMGDLRSTYRLLRAELSQAGYRFVTMDVRGFGETSARWKDYSAHAVGRDALALLAQLKAGPAVIVGNSFAAGSALWAAHDAPTQVKGVVLSGPIVRNLKTPWYAMAAVNVGLAGPWRVGFWMTYWNSLFPKGKPADHEQVKAALAKNLREPGRMDALRAMIALSKADTAALISGNRVPTLILMGTRDPDFPNATAEARWLAETMKAESLVVEGAGHYTHLETLDQVMPKVLTFLDGLNAKEAPRG